MATKFKLDPNPTFKAKVSIPVPGGKAEPVEFTFKHFTRDEYVALFTGEDGEAKTDHKLLTEILSGWDLDDEFSGVNIERLLQNYHGAARAIVQVFADQLGQNRLGN